MKWISGLGTGVLALTLAACGGGTSSDTSTGTVGSAAATEEFADQSAEEIASWSSSDMMSASAMRMSGIITEDGKSFTVDVEVTTRGDCQGTISVPDQGITEILRVGRESWFRPDPQFWKVFGGPSAEKIIRVVGDRWVVLPQSEDEFSKLCDLDNFFGELAKPENLEEVEKGEVEEVGGQEAIVLTSRNDDPVTAWIATDSPHYFLQMEVTSGDEPGRLTFSDFDADFGIKAPVKGEAVDLGQMSA